MIDPQVAYDKLISFETANQLRDFFISEGITGWPHNGAICPMANWLTQQCCRQAVVSLYIGVGLHQFKHTEATADFIDGFDEGKYPELFSTNLVRKIGDNS